MDTLPRLGLQISQQQRAWFSPDPTITAYELALCMDVLLTHWSDQRTAQEKFLALPDAAKRHFVTTPL